MIMTCPVCKEPFLTEADPYIVIPSSKGYEHRCTCGIRKLQEENKSLRSDLDWLCKGLGFYLHNGPEMDKLQDIVKKHKLDEVKE